MLCAEASILAARRILARSGMLPPRFVRLQDEAFELTHSLSLCAESLLDR